MKEKLGLRNVILWAVALALLIMFFASFGMGAKISMYIPGETPVIASARSVIWGTHVVSGSSGGPTYAQYFPTAALSVPGLIGVILLLLASGGLVAITFLVKDAKLAKILTLVAAGVVVAGGILLFFVAEVMWTIMGNSMETEVGYVVSASTMKDMYGQYAKVSSPSGVASGIFAILFAGAIVATQFFIPDIKFIKSK